MKLASSSKAPHFGTLAVIERSELYLIPEVVQFSYDQHVVSVL